MTQMTVTLVLTGARAGRTCVLNGKQFTDGEFKITADPKTIESVCTYMGRCYKAFPKGSDELALAQARDRGEDITDGRHTNTAEAGESRPAEALSGDDHKEFRSFAEEGAAQRSVDADSDGGGSRVRSTGNGHEHAGLSNQGEGSEHGSSNNPRLQGVIQDLDPDLDENWTKTGKPALAAVQKAYGADVTRQDINNAVPDWNREKAQEKALSEM